MMKVEGSVFLLTNFFGSQLHFLDPGDLLKANCLFFGCSNNCSHLNRFSNVDCTYPEK
jgi:hypothetical protein